MATRAAKTPAAKAPAIPPEQATVVLVWGGDEYRVAQRAKQLLQVWCPPEQQDLGLEVVDGAVETIDEAVAAIQRVLDGIATVGLFGGAKVVWLREAMFFSEAVPGKFEAVKEAVGRLTEEIKRGLMPGQRLLITASKVHRGYGFYKACVAAGAVVEFEVSDKPKEMMEQAQVTVRELLKAEQLTASGTTVHLLVEKAGYDTRLLHQEVTKLATYLGDRREVTEEDVRLLVSPSRESIAWDLAEVLSQRDLAACLRLFRQLMFQKEKPFVLLMGIEGRIRDMLALRELMEAGHLRLEQSGSGYASVVVSQQPEAVEAAQSLIGHLLKGHPYRLLVLTRAASTFRTPELRRWYRKAVQAHARITEGGVPDELLLECLLVDLIQGGSRAAAS